MKVTVIERPYFNVIIHSRENDKDDEAVIKEMFTENVYRLNASQLGKRPVVLDIGANIGTFTLLTLKVAQEAGKPVKIYAVEPEANNLNLLRQNLQANSQLLSNGSQVNIIDKAVSDFTGKMRITNDSGGSRLSQEYDLQEVDVITYDELVKNIPKIDFTKIDIEGSELELISGASQKSILKSHYYAIEFDQFNDRPSFWKTLMPFMDDFSFETWGIPANGCNIYLENHHWEK